MNDAQSGYETGMNTVAALLAGADIFNMGGLLGSLMAFDFAKAVIDNEIALMLKRIHRGVDFSDEELKTQLIAEIGPGGSYMDSEHTIEHMRKTAFFPNVATRKTRDVWLKTGQHDAGTRAMNEVSAILSKENPAVFSKEIDDKIRTRFKGLVAGIGGWKK
jgi:trimethylamine--corrinoid protein Co-methyltransferase